MRRLKFVVSGLGLGLVIGVVLLLAGGVAYLRSTGLSTRAEPGTVEAYTARMARHLAIPSGVLAAQNPVSSTPEALADGMAHYADHCASCHANDGSGNTEMGRGFYPKAPDMRLTATQELSDGELFYVIENGIRFTGMPAWGTGTASGEESTWRLVHFLRRLPQLTSSEIEAMKERNPRSPEEIRLELEEERFLNQGAQQ